MTGTALAVVTNHAPAAVLPVFDYEALGDELGLQALDAAKKIRGLQARGAELIFEIGAELIEIKDKLGHGKFGPWLEAEVNMTARTAQNYMNVAAAFAGKNETVSYLKPTTLYALGAAPPVVKAAIIAWLDVGEKPADAEVKREIEAQKERDEADGIAKHDAERRAKLTPEERTRQEKNEARKKRDWARLNQKDQDVRAQREKAGADLAALLAREVTSRERLLELIEACGHHIMTSILAQAIKDALSPPMIEAQAAAPAPVELAVIPSPEVVPDLRPSPVPPGVDPFRAGYLAIVAGLPVAPAPEAPAPAPAGVDRFRAGYLATIAGLPVAPAPAPVEPSPVEPSPVEASPAEDDAGGRELVKIGSKAAAEQDALRHAGEGYMEYLRREGEDAFWARIKIGSVQEWIVRQALCSVGWKDPEPAPWSHPTTR